MRLDRKDRSEDDASVTNTTLILSLSLFIILLAFFIVLNGLSEFSEPKVEQAFDSLDSAFSTSIAPSNFNQSSADEREENKDGKGDAIEDLQGTLRSILPNLNITSVSNSSGGQIMIIRIRKNKFKKISSVIFPLFVRILNEKDDEHKYSISITTQVRDTLSKQSEKSMSTISRYASEMKNRGLSASRLSLAVEKGNPAFLYFRFYEGEGG